MNGQEGLTLNYKQPMYYINIYIILDFIA